MSGIIEFSNLIGVIRETHKELGAWLKLDPFDVMFHEINGSYDPTSIRGLLSTHIVKVLSNDLFPNCNFNVFTERFIESTVALKKIELEKVQKLPSKYLGFGPLCAKAYEKHAKMTSGCVDRRHIEALTQDLLGGKLDLPFIVDVSTVICTLYWHDFIL